MSAGPRTIVGTLSEAMKKRKQLEATQLVGAATDLKAAIEGGYTRMSHADFHQLIWPVITAAPGTADMTVIARVAKSPMAPIIVVDAVGNEIYRLPALWNTRNLVNRATSRHTSISATSDQAALRANSGLVPPAQSDQFIVNSIAHLINNVEISDEDRKNWEAVFAHNSGKPTTSTKAVVVKQGVELDGDYDDL